MNRSFLTSMILCCAATTGVAAPTPRMPKQYTIEQFLNTTALLGASFSADEQEILVSGNQTGIYNAYTVRLAGGPLRQVTKSTKETTMAVSFFPKDNRILFTRDQDGNEMSHIYLLDTDGAERDLTPGEKTKATFVRWTRDDAGFYYRTNVRDPRFFDLYRMDVTQFEPKLLYQDTVGYFLGTISNDEKYLAFSKPRTTTDSDIYIYSMADKQMKHISQHTGEATYTPETFDPQGRYLYYITNDGSEFTYLARYQLSNGRKENVERAPWDVMFTSFSRNGKYRVVGINEDARIRIKVYEEATGKRIELPSMPDGEITFVRIARSEKQMAFYFNGDRSPSNLYVCDIGSKQARKLTNSLNPEIDSEDLVDSQIIRYKSFDGLEIPSILYKPHQASTENKVPALVWVHGGPGGQTRCGYSGMIQFFVNHGYVVLGVNNRGSSGYGKTFFMADDRRHGREPLWDCVEAKKYLVSLGYVDPQKIGIIGGSYGGYMTLAALTLKPTEFTVGVDLFGISNWVRTLELMPAFWEAQREALYREIGDPRKDRDMLLSVSPLFHADKIVRPLMVLQGANDPRVIKPESDDIVDAVRKRGGIVEYIVFSDEGHGFTKKANQIKGYQAILKFLDKHLKKD